MFVRQTCIFQKHMLLLTRNTHLYFYFSKTSVFTMNYTPCGWEPFWDLFGTGRGQWRSRAEPGRAEPSRAEPSRAGPGRAEPGRAEPGRAEPPPSHRRRQPGVSSTRNVALDRKVASRVHKTPSLQNDPRAVAAAPHFLPSHFCAQAPEF